MFDLDLTRENKLEYLEEIGWVVSISVKMMSKFHPSAHGRWKTQKSNKNKFYKLIKKLIIIIKEIFIRFFKLKNFILVYEILTHSHPC